MNFGEQIKKLRKTHNITQQEMSERLGVSRQAISHWENDRNLPDIEMLITISKVFSISLDELILGGREMNNMTEKIINDSGETKKIKLKLQGIKLGFTLFLLSLISYLSGLFFAPVRMENYFSEFSQYTMISGFIIILVVGLVGISQLMYKKLPLEENIRAVVGPILLILGILIYLFSMYVSFLSGLWGILLSIVGIICIAAEYRHQK